MAQAVDEGHYGRPGAPGDRASDTPAAAPGDPSAAKPEEKPETPAEAAAAARKKRLKIVIGGTIALVGVIGAILYYIHSLRFEDTDDAQIDGDISALSPRVTGTVKAVNVVDNQVVHAGDLLVVLDPGDYDVAVAQARANVTEAEAQVKVENPNVPITETSNRTTMATTRSDVSTAVAAEATSVQESKQVEAQLVQAEANNKLAQIELERSSALLASGSVAQADYDQRKATADAAAANVAAMREAVAASKKRIDEARARLAASASRAAEIDANAPRQLEARQATLQARQASVEVAKAQLAQAELNASYTRIVAPVDGVVGKKAVNVGDRVQPGQQLLAITQTHDLWVTANFRETQVKKMHSGQAVTMHVDALGKDFTGQVESMPGATGSRYSLLPPENASGNYVKVVQRLPVRIHIDPGQDGYDRLRPGMSVEPKVTLR